MERCPECGRMTFAYDYRRQDWVCVCYDCNYARDSKRQATGSQSEEPEARARGVRKDEGGELKL